jgi:NADH:ubiquinone oxidoreductase subunit 2 (subunit N)
LWEITVKGMSFSLIFLSSMVVFSRISWILIWVMMELNTLAFTCLKVVGKNSFACDDMKVLMKYFIVQSLTSVFLVASVILIEQFEFIGLVRFIMVLSLMVKIACSPFHLWFIYIVEESDLKVAFMLMSWQKLLPVLVLSQSNQSWLIVFVFTTSIFPFFEQLVVGRMLKIIALSSVFNNSWLLVRVRLSVVVIIVFIILYWAAVLVLLALLSGVKRLFEVKAGRPFFSLMFSFNLAGLPPTSSFFAKWVVFVKIMKFGLFTIGVYLVLLTVINTFVYARLVSGDLFNEGLEGGSKSILKIMFTLSVFSVPLWI